MRVELEDFKINTVASLTDEHPRFYNKVTVEYHFFGQELDKEKIEKAVDLSVTRYCGVMEMFRGFSGVKIEIKYN
jgi:putative redox protein